MGNGFFATDEYIEQNPEVIEALITSLLTTYRRVNSDPDYLFDQAPKFLPGINEDPEKLREIIDTYIGFNVWDSNGGFNEEAADLTVGLFVEVGDLEEASPFEDWAALGPMNAVLDAIGRE